MAARRRQRAAERAEAVPFVVTYRDDVTPRPSRSALPRRRRRAARLPRLSLPHAPAVPLPAGGAFPVRGQAPPPSCYCRCGRRLARGCRADCGAASASARGEAVRPLQGPAGRRPGAARSGGGDRAREVSEAAAGPAGGEARPPGGALRCGWRGGCCGVRPRLGKRRS